MKTLTLMLALFAAPALAEPPAAADRAALAALAAEADAAWNAKDAERMAAVYSGGASLLLSAGPAIEGRDAIRASFERNFAARQDVMRHVTTVDRVELIDPDLALSDGGVRVEQQQADGSWTLMRSFRNVSLLRREGGQWKLAAVRAIMVANPR